MMFSFTDYEGLTKLIEFRYGLKNVELKLHRAMIGLVYLVDTPSGRYVFKLYRSFNTIYALQSAQIHEYLRQNNYPAAHINPDIQGQQTITVDTPEGPCTGILYTYIEGIEPDGDAEIAELGFMTGELHQVMAHYPHPLVRHSQDTYIGDFLSIMNRMEYDRIKTAELKQYGDELWARISRLPASFCHGDLHTGNMLRSQTSGAYILFDFDDASGDYPSMDVAYMSDDSHFNCYAEAAYDKTRRKFERFYTGYSKQRTMSELEIQAICDFVAVRHYQIIARIVRCKGLQEISREFLDQQYDWLMKWNNLCQKHRGAY